MADMILNPGKIERHCAEPEVYNSLLQLDGCRLLELGCGKAELTRAIAGEGVDRQLVALEVDEVQHRANLLIDDLPNVEFRLAGAQAIPAESGEFDVAFMFKSLHHVPGALLERALEEVHRVLKPGGHAYISEPVFDGDFNEILRLFHDEEQVRAAAFAALRQAVDKGKFELAEEVFFNSSIAFADFDDFEQKVIRVTHTDLHLPPGLFEEVRSRFMSRCTADGAVFTMPMRVDLLRKPA